MKFIATARLIFASAAIASSFVCGAGAQSTADKSWLIGHWQVTSDQDRKNSDLGIVIQFLPDGGVVTYNKECDADNDPSEIGYTIERRYIYVTNHLAGNDHAALTLHVSRNRKKLSLKWPNTGVTAILERVPSNTCVKQS